MKLQLREPEVATGTLKLATHFTAKRGCGPRWDSSTGRIEKLLGRRLDHVNIGKHRVRVFMPGACMKGLFSTQRHGQKHKTHADRKEV